jgi:putative transposase
MGVQGEWPVYGIPKTIHYDNGKELRGIDLTRFCGEYGIEVMWRPVGRSHFGGHIERLIGTISKKVHGLPGTTFSNITQKGKYDSEKNAAFTISEIEQWVLEELVNNYHKTVHSMIGMTPIEKYFEGVFGLADYPGTGLPPTITDSIMLRASLLPAKSRCIQQDGITIDHITYYSDVLRDFIEPKGLKNSNKTKHLVRRDPRDISKVYFYHQKIKKYFEIPYRNIGNPKMDLSELRASIAKAKEEAGFAPIEEVKIIDKHKKLKAIENKAVEKTKLVRRKASSKKHLEEKMKDMPKAETALPRQTNTFKSDTQGDEIKPNAPKNLHVDFLDDEDEE